MLLLFKRGYKATKCKLWSQAKKICKENRKKTSKDDDTFVNAAIAIAEPEKEATIADAEIWACYTSMPIVKNQDQDQDSKTLDYIYNDKSVFLEIQRLLKLI